MHFIRLYFMRRLNQRRISVELCDIARRIIRQRRIKCDTSNKISLDVAFPSNKIGGIKCDELNATELRRLNQALECRSCIEKVARSSPAG